MVTIKVEKLTDEKSSVESKLEGTANEVLNELLMAINQCVKCIGQASGIDRTEATAVVMEMLIDKIDE